MKYTSFFVLHAIGEAVELGECINNVSDMIFTKNNILFIELD